MIYHRYDISYVRLTVSSATVVDGVGSVALGWVG